MCSDSESVAVRLRGQGICRHKRHIALYSPLSYLGSGRIRLSRTRVGLLQGPGGPGPGPTGKL
jgi:hypothetical protein